MTSSVELIRDLVREFQELQPMFDEHLEDHDDQVLPYLLLSDLARWAGPEVTRHPARIADLCHWLEQRFETGNEEVKTLVAVGFVEMLPATPEGDPLLDLLGPSMYKVAQEMNLTEPWR